MKIRPAGADLIHEDRLGEFAKSSKSMQRGLCNNYCLKTVNFPFIGVRSESLHRYLFGTVPKRAALPLVTTKHSTVLKPNIPHYHSDNSKATSSLGYILRQNAKIKEKYIIFIMWVLKIIHSTGRINKRRI
jgi:hypothetical protein